MISATYKILEPEVVSVTLLGLRFKKYILTTHLTTTDKDCLIKETTAELTELAKETNERYRELIDNGFNTKYSYNEVNMDYGILMAAREKSNRLNRKYNLERCNELNPSEYKELEEFMRPLELD